jgi:hypothetical protein
LEKNTMTVSAAARRLIVSPESPCYCPINWVATLISRLLVPPAEALLKWPHRTGQVRPLGRTFAYIHAVAAALVVTFAFFLCTAAESAITDAVASDSLASRYTAAWDNAQLLSPLGRLFSAVAHPVILFVTAFLVVGVILVENRRWEAAPTEQKPVWWKLTVYFVRFHSVLFILYVAAVVLAVSFCLVFFPGLLGQGTPTALLPWQAWFAIAAAGLVVRSLTVTNGRFDEFTGRLTRSLSDAYRPRYQIWALVVVLVHGFCNGLREKLRGGSFGTGFDAVADVYTPGCLAFERRLVAHLASAIEFYRHEGLDTLTDPKNPEAVHYTPAQRAAFVATFAKLQEQHASAVRWLARLTARPLGHAPQPEGVPS